MFNVVVSPCLLHRILIKTHSPIIRRDFSPQGQYNSVIYGPISLPRSRWHLVGEGNLLILRDIRFFFISALKTRVPTCASFARVLFSVFATGVDTSGHGFVDLSSISPTRDPQSTLTKLVCSKRLFVTPRPDFVLAAILELPFPPDPLF